jgi:hypothetical protein
LIFKGSITNGLEETLLDSGSELLSIVGADKVVDTPFAWGLLA